MNRVAVLLTSTETTLTAPTGFDFDHDGRREFVIRVSESDTVSGGRHEFYESPANNTFVLVHVLELADHQNDSFYPADAGDTDSDGLADLTVLAKDWVGQGTNDYGVYVYESLSAATHPTVLAWGDSPRQDGSWWVGGKVTDGDNDGKQEIYVGQPEGPEFVVYENNGDNSYSEVYSETVGLYDSGQSFAVLNDLDDDGRNEVLYGQVGAIFAFESIGDDAYEQIWSWYFDPGINVTFIVDAGDLDGDGSKEFLAGGLKPNPPFDSWLHVFEAVSDNEVEIVETFALPNSIESYSSARVADVDGDGDREIVFATTFNIAIYKNVGLGTWQTIWAEDWWSLGVGPVRSVGAGDHDGDGLDEIIFRQGGWEEGFTGVWEIDPADAADFDGDGTVDAIDNCPSTNNPEQEDADQDNVGDFCDNCVHGPNPEQGLAIFGQEIHALNPDTFFWPEPAEIVYARGNLALVDSYTVDFIETLPVGTSFVDLSVPESGKGHFYLVKPDCLVGSWQTALGAEPGLDAALP